MRRFPARSRDRAVMAALVAGVIAAAGTAFGLTTNSLFETVRAVFHEGPSQ